MEAARSGGFWEGDQGRPVGRMLMEWNLESMRDEPFAIWGNRRGYAWTLLGPWEEQDGWNRMIKKGVAGNQPRDFMGSDLSGPSKPHTGRSLSFIGSEPGAPEWF